MYKILYYLLLMIPNNLREIMLEDKTDRVHNIIKIFKEGTDERRYIIHDIPGITYIPDSNSIYTKYSNENADENDKIILAKIQNYIINKNIIEHLENPNTYIYHKLELVEKYTNICDNDKIQSVNLFAGDLYKTFYDLSCDTLENIDN